MHTYILSNLNWTSTLMDHHPFKYTYIHTYLHTLNILTNILTCMLTYRRRLELWCVCRSFIQQSVSNNWDQGSKNDHPFSRSWRFGYACMYVCIYVCTYVMLARTTLYCTVKHLYILAEMYVVVCILMMCSYSTKYSLYMTSVPIPHWIGT